MPEEEKNHQGARVPWAPGRGQHPRPGRLGPLPDAHLFQGPRGVALTLVLLALLLGAPYVASRQQDRERINRESLARERTGSAARLAARQQDQTRRLAALQKELRDLERRMARRDEVEQRVGAVQRAVAQVESTVFQRLSREVERSLGQSPDLQAARDAVARIEETDSAPEKLIAQYGRSVCLVQGTYGFGKMRDGEFLYMREATPDLLDGMEVSADKLPLTLDGDGPLFLVEYTGTAFLVDGSGILLTNRHIAQPWWRNDAADPLLAEGYEPRFFHLRAYFPGHSEPVEIERARTVTSDEADLALLFFRPFEGQPTRLQLGDSRGVQPGQRVLLLGYPSGLDALLARADEGFADRVADEEGTVEPGALLAALLEENLVRPLPTLGHVGDVLHDSILFDAATAVGGSGGPLIDMDGRVVAINYGILKAFRGANFGVPSAYAARLLARAHGD